MFFHGHAMYVVICSFHSWGHLPIQWPSADFGFAGMKSAHQVGRREVRPASCCVSRWQFEPNLKPSFHVRWRTRSKISNVAPLRAHLLGRFHTLKRLWEVDASINYFKTEIITSVNWLLHNLNACIFEHCGNEYSWCWSRIMIKDKSELSGNVCYTCVYIACKISSLTLYL